MIGKTIAFVALFALALDSIPVVAQQSTPDFPATFNCETSMQSGLGAVGGKLRSVFYERDTIVPMGNGWFHGMARPTPSPSASTPAPKPTDEPAAYYDYYIYFPNPAQKDGTRQYVYIQVAPSTNKSEGSFFVGTSPGGSGGMNGSWWSVVYPLSGESYHYTEYRPSPGAPVQQFTITYKDLTQVCTRTALALPPQPTPQLACSTTILSDVPTQSFDSYMSITPIRTANWWQGLVTDSRAPGGKILYGFDIFTIGTRRFAVVINVARGTYAIATSHLQQDLRDTGWTIVYPKLEAGFTFNDVVYPEGGKLPVAFKIVFKDGFQQCAVPQK
ncbi:MAG TPA: hypothetical protein VMA98_02615 [Candidatus Acidoferrales bacterium]|nr:hypothetical protein [Candidatus Acidoferrales bacterium]